ncbi:hypothetical protein BT63DRAFT_133513 [Microthyrium microscopicum]|uniref:SRR1-like domain-containing protein n=1 Tax=Microthyrium microscopicum TaxID=703497 RepID=A0A6A6UNM4_9PEZI|nr:hypothetical protein BT63DRAFT_133513 [Microthyrium microscopicum]
MANTSNSSNSTQDPWTIVSRHKKHTKQQPTRKAKAQKPRPSSSSPSSLDEADIITILDRLRRNTTTWLTSPQHTRLSAILSCTAPPSRAIIAGLGNLDPSAPRDHHRALWQLALFLGLVRIFHPDWDPLTNLSTQLTSQPPISLTAQDPVFTPFDVETLSRVGITVDANAIEHANANTVLFAPFVDAVVLMPQILKGRDMSVYIGTDVHEVMERMEMSGYAAQ